MQPNQNTLKPFQTRNKSPYRRTSAEIVSEAKNMLAGSGTRLVITRRPVTPREPRRQLYDRIAPPPNRPPSAFSLRYLQFESRALPSLDPIQRSESAESFLDTNSKSNKLQGKLPSLLLPPPKVTGPLEVNTNVAKENEVSIINGNSGLEILPGKSTSVSNSTSIVKDHPLKKRQTKSFDGKFALETSQGKSHEKLKENDEKNNKKISKDIKTKLTRSNDLLCQSSTETLLEMLKGHTGIKECTEETVVLINGILTELYSRVKGARGSWRGAVLGALYGLVECTSAKILLSVARVVLALAVTGSNLTGACKLVFKVARNETNDSLFLDCDVPELLIEGLGRANPLEEPEACIYGYGAVRFLAGATISTPSINIKGNISKIKDEAQIKIKPRSLAWRLARHGAVPLMILHLQMLNEFGAQSKLIGSPLHALFQLSGALRALAGAPLALNFSSRTKISSPSQPTKCPQIFETLEPGDVQLELAGPHLVRAAEICIGETEVQANIIRTLSVLSEIDSCCETLAESVARLGVLLGPCGATNVFPEKSLGSLSRLGYILGNIMARFDTARIQFFNNDVAMEYLFATMEHYSNNNFTKSLSVCSGGDTVIDVLIKLVRIIANMSVNEEVGHGLGIRPSLGGILLNLLQAANTCKGNMSAEMEELLLATLGALHNLCFYQDIQGTQSKNQQGSTIERLGELSASLCTTLSVGPSNAKPEAARVLGNMTASPVARQAFCNAGGLKVIVNCLESDDLELVATCCGVLVNLLSDWDRRAPFRELKGPPVLRIVLQKAALQEDWLLSGIVCQALWNFLIDSGNIIGALGGNEADYITGDLSEYLDEEKLFNGEAPDELWEQFAMVATDLLERIQTAISVTNSPCISSEDEDIQVEQIGAKWGDQFKRWLEE